MSATSHFSILFCNFIHHCFHHFFSFFFNCLKADWRFTILRSFAQNLSWIFLGRCTFRKCNKKVDFFDRKKWRTPLIRPAVVFRRNRGQIACRRRGRLFIRRFATGCNCFVIREHTIKTESSRGAVWREIARIGGIRWTTRGPGVAVSTGLIVMRTQRRDRNRRRPFTRYGQKLTGLNGFSLISFPAGSTSQSTRITIARFRANAPVARGILPSRVRTKPVQRTRFEWTSRLSDESHFPRLITSTRSICGGISSSGRDKSSQDSGFVFSSLSELIPRQHKRIVCNNKPRPVRGL